MAVMTLPVISLFCGAGGLDCGFHQAGFKTLVAYDSSPSAVLSYNLNSSTSIAQQADISRLKPIEIVKAIREVSPDVPPVGVIGGPPCQGFSCGNVHADPDDERNTLPLRFARLLKELNDIYALHFFVFENVTGLSGPKHAARFESIRLAFEQAGFRLFQQTLNAHDFGIPQTRRRLFLVGLNTSLYKDVQFLFPVGCDARLTVRDAISGLPDPTFFTRGMRTSNNAHHPNHWTMMPKSSKFLTQTFSEGRSFKRLSWDVASPTVAYGNREIHIHPSGTRRLSVYEAMLLQGFPRDYQLCGNFSEQITQVSNAVPPPLAKALAERLKNLLYQQRCSALAQLLAQTGVSGERYNSRGSTYPINPRQPGQWQDI